MFTIRKKSVCSQNQHNLSERIGWLNNFRILLTEKQYCYRNLQHWDEIEKIVYYDWLSLIRKANIPPIRSGVRESKPSQGQMSTITTWIAETRVKRLNQEWNILFTFWSQSQPVQQYNNSTAVMILILSKSTALVRSRWWGYFRLMYAMDAIPAS